MKRISTIFRRDKDKNKSSKTTPEASPAASAEASSSTTPNPNTYLTGNGNSNSRNQNDKQQAIYDAGPAPPPKSQAGPSSPPSARPTPAPPIPQAVKDAHAQKSPAQPNNDVPKSGTISETFSNYAEVLSAAMRPLPSGTGDGTYLKDDSSDDDNEPSLWDDLKTSKLPLFSCMEHPVQYTALKIMSEPLLT